MDKWRRNLQIVPSLPGTVVSSFFRQECTFADLKAYFFSVSAWNTLSGGEGVFLPSARSVFPAEGLFVMILLQMGPWQKNYHIFSLPTPNEVNPKPTSSFRRARSDGIIFTVF